MIITVHYSINCLTDFDSYDVLVYRDVPFGVSLILLPILGMKCREILFGGVNSIDFRTC